MLIIIVSYDVHTATAVFLFAWNKSFTCTWQQVSFHGGAVMFCFFVFFTEAQKIQTAIHPDWILIKDFFFFVLRVCGIKKKMKFLILT